MKLAYSVVEPTNGKASLCPVILLHCMLASKKSWVIAAPQIANATIKTVYCVDARNHGESPWTDDFTLQFMVDDIKEFMKDREISKAIFVGNGMGGSVAMKLALEEPELVEYLIVEDLIPEIILSNRSEKLLVHIQKLKAALRRIPEGSDLTTAMEIVSEAFDVPKVKIVHPDQIHEFGFETTILEENGEYRYEANLDTIETALQDGHFDDHPTGTWNGEAYFLHDDYSEDELSDEDAPEMFPQSRYFHVEGSTLDRHFTDPDEFIENVVAAINGSTPPGY